MRSTCDKYHSKIINGQCDCGEWFEADEIPLEAKIIKDALKYFASRDVDIVSADDPNGNAVIFFKGNYKDVMIARHFIESLIKINRKK